MGHMSKYYATAYEQGFRTLAEIPQEEWPTAGDDVEFYEFGTVHLLEASRVRGAEGNTVDNLITYKGRQHSDGLVFDDAVRSHHLIKVTRNGQ